MAYLQLTTEELNSIFIVVLVLNCLTFLSSAFLAVYSFKQTRNKITVFFTVLMAIFTLWSLLKIVAMFVHSLALQILISDFLRSITVFTPALILAIVVLYTKHPRWAKLKHLYILIAITVILAVFSATDGMHHLLVSNYSIDYIYGIPILKIDGSAIHLVYLIHLYLCLFSAIYVLIRTLLDSTNFFRTQVALILLAIAFPAINDVFYWFNLSLIPGYHLITVSFAIGNLFFAWALFGFRFLKLIPIARSLVIDSIADIVIVTDSDDIIIDINKAGENILDVNASKLIGVKFNVGFANYTQLLQFYNSGDKGEIIVDSGNELYYFSVTRKFVFSVSNEKLASIVLMHDISERKQHELKIGQYSQELLELNKTKDKFFSILAHDLKNPFAGIIGISEAMMTSKRRNDPDEMLKMVNYIHISAKSAYELLENLLEWSRAQTGKIAYKPTKMIFEHLYINVLELVIHQAENKNITIRADFDTELSFVADAYMLSTVLRNLLTNAIKFTPNSGTVVVSAKKSNSEIIIAVADSGVGIEATKMERLFKISEKVSTAGTDNETGTGLGLLLCKEFIDRHNGKIWFESEVNKGSTFHFTIPQL